MDAGVENLMRMQNLDGGFGSYEKSRAPALIELLNPAEVFGMSGTGEASYRSSTLLP